MVGASVEKFPKEMGMAVVIDEWGSFGGLVTVEDIVEEIVGEIRDEFDAEEPTIRELSDGAYSVDGGVPIETVNEALDSRFESGDFGTIGGLVFGHLGRSPGAGDEVRIDGSVLRVEETDGPRVTRLAVRRNRGQDRRGERTRALCIAFEPPPCRGTRTGGLCS
jgi:CBS domain containing-hemolysin-like protein